MRPSPTPRTPPSPGRAIAVVETGWPRRRVVPVRPAAFRLMIPAIVQAASGSRVRRGTLAHPARSTLVKVSRSRASAAFRRPRPAPLLARPPTPGPVPHTPPTRRSSSSILLLARAWGLARSRRRWRGRPWLDGTGLRGARAEQRVFDAWSRRSRQGCGGRGTGASARSTRAARSPALRLGGARRRTLARGHRSGSSAHHTRCTATLPGRSSAARSPFPSTRVDAPTRRPRRKRPSARAAEARLRRRSRCGGGPSSRPRYAAFFHAASRLLNTHHASPKRQFQADGNPNGTGCSLERSSP